jgi:hypothetical protein
MQPVPPCYQTTQNYTNAEIPCAPRYHIRAVQILQQKMVLVLCASHIFNQLPAHDPYSCTIFEQSLGHDLRQINITTSVLYNNKEDDDNNINNMMKTVMKTIITKTRTITIMQNVHKIKKKNIVLCAKFVTFNATAYDIMAYMSYI